MRPFLTAVIAAIEAAAVACAGIVLVGVPAVLIWIVTYGLAAEPEQVLVSSLAVWQLAHFIPLGFELTAETAGLYGLAQTPLSFTISLAPLGLTLVTWALAARTGWRLGRHGGAGSAGLVGGAAGFAAIATGVAFFVPGVADVWPLWARIAVPTLSFVVPAAVAFVVRAAREDHHWWERSLVLVLRGLDAAAVPGVAALPARAAEILRLAVALFAMLMGVAACGVAVAIVLGYVDVVTLTQQLQLDGFGAIVLFVLQLLLLPVAVLWGLAWLSGAGFAVGEGSSVSPFETLLGPVPALPLFGAMPQSWGGAGAIAPAILVLLALGIGVFCARRAELARSSWAVALSVPACAAVLVGLGVVGLTVLSSGSIGPERLSETGGAPWVVGALIAGEIWIGATLGVAVGRVDTARVRATLSDRTAGSDLLSRISSGAGGVFAASSGRASRAKDGGALDPLSSDHVSFDPDSFNPDSSDLDDFAPDEQETVDLSDLATPRAERENAGGAAPLSHTHTTDRTELSDLPDITELADDNSLDAETTELEPLRGSEPMDTRTSGDRVEARTGMDAAGSEGADALDRVDASERVDALERVEGSAGIDDAGADGAGTDDADLDADELLQAFAWDAPVTPAPEEPGRRNWRRPRSER